MSTAMVESSSVLITPHVEVIRILHVDDDQAFLEVSRQILCMENNFEIENASSVDEALIKLQSKKYDVIISDYEMPQKDGLQLLRELKEQGNQTPFILFTGKGREEVAIKALNLGADRYFNKQGSPETVYGELAFGIRAVHSHRKAEKKCFDEQMLRTILLDNVPCTALILEKTTRTIVASNKIAKEQGAIPGKKCYESCAELTAPCSFCLAPKVWATNQPQSIEVEVKGKYYRGVWVPYNQGLYVHYIFDITKQKKTEIDLQQKYEVIERLGDSVGAGLAIIDKDYRVFWANSTLKNIGVTVSKKCYESFNLKDVCPDCGVKKVFEQNVPLDIHEYKSVSDDGTRSWVELRVTPLKDKNGVITAALELAVPMTERKQKEEELKNSKNFVEKILYSTPNLIYIYSLKDQCNTYSNKEVTDFLGYSPKQIREFGDKLFSKVLHPDDVQRVAEHHSKFSNAPDNAVFEIEYRMKHADGNWRWLRSRDVLFSRDENGKVEAILGSCEDISERKKTKDILQANEQRLRTCLENSPLAIFVADPTGKYLYVNEAGCKLVDYTKDELLTKSIPQLVSNYDVEKGMQSFERAKKTGKSSREAYLKKKDGSSVAVSFHAARLPDGNVIGFCEDLTEKRKYKDEKRDLEEKYETLFEQNPAALAVYDIKGNQIQVNNSYEQLWGIPREFTVNKFNILQSQQIQEKWLPHIQKAYAGETVRIPEVEYDSALEPSTQGKGKKRWLRTTICPLKNEEHKVEGIMLMHEDITECKKTQEALSESQKKFKDLVETTDDFVWEINSEGLYTYCSPQMKKLWGYDPKEAVGKSPFDVMPTVEKEEAIETAREMTESQQDFVGLITAACDSTGKLIYAETNSLPFYDNNGNLLGYRGISRDITQRQLTEERLKANEEKFRTLFEGMAQGAFWQNADGTLLDVNNSALEMLGITEKEFRSRNSFSPQWKVITEDGRLLKGGEYPSMISLRTGKSIAGTYGVFNPKKNEYSWMYINAVPQFKNKNDKPFQVFVTMHDVSERQNAQEKIKAISEKLRVVGNLTRHDVSNKLSTINADTYLLKKRIGEDTEKLKYIKSIETAVSQANRLFEFGRQYEKIGLEEPEKVVIEHFFNQATTLHNEQKNIVFKNQTQGLKVVADSLLRLVFHNFIDDSIRHGKKVTEIRLHYKEEKNFTKLIYEDNGIGIPKENKSRLFTEGFSTGGGTGLGLALSKKILQVYGWAITEDGTPGKGAKFIITIPKSTQPKKTYNKGYKPNA